MLCTVEILRRLVIEFCTISICVLVGSERCMTTVDSVLSSIWEGNMNDN